MTEPRRWLDPESDARTFEREALELAKPVRIPAGSEDRVWQRVALLTQVSPVTDPSAAGAGAGAGGAAPSVASGALGVIKVFVAAAVGGFALAGGGYAALVDDPPHAARPSVVLTSAPRAADGAPVTAPSSPEAHALEPSEPATPEVAPAPRRGAASSLPNAVPSSVERRPEAFDLPSDASTAVNESQLKEEVALIREARARLRAGDLGGAFAALETARTRFPHAVLSEEREALTIELLSRSGRAESARERARAFLSQFPESSLRKRMLELAGSRESGE